MNDLAAQLKQAKRDKACIVIAFMTIIEYLRTDRHEVIERESLIVTAMLAMEKIAEHDPELLEMMKTITDELLKEEDAVYRKEHPS